MTPRVSSRRAAQLLGVATKTLANWRCEGKGPKGWTRLNRTLVVYRMDEIEAFIAERSAATYSAPAQAVDTLAAGEAV